MANTMTYELGTGRRPRLAGRARKALADYRLYRQTLDELQALSDRELRDLGISRFTIRDVAQTASTAREPDCSTERRKAGTNVPAFSFAPTLHAGGAGGCPTPAGSWTQASAASSDG